MAKNLSSKKKRIFLLFFVLLGVAIFLNYKKILNLNFFFKSYVFCLLNVFSRPTQSVVDGIFTFNIIKLIFLALNHFNQSEALF